MGFLKAIRKAEKSTVLPKESAFFALLDGDKNVS